MYRRTGRLEQVSHHRVAPAAEPVRTHPEITDQSLQYAQRSAVIIFGGGFRRDISAADSHSASRAFRFEFNATVASGRFNRFRLLRLAVKQVVKTGRRRQKATRYRYILAASFPNLRKMAPNLNVCTYAFTAQINRKIPSAQHAKMVNCPSFILC